MARIKFDLHLKKGALHRMLAIPQDMKFTPEILDLLAEIAEAPLGSEVVNNAGIGRKEFTVTRLLKERAVLALNMHNWHRPKKVVEPIKAEPVKKATTKKVAAKKETVKAEPEKPVKKVTVKKETVKKEAIAVAPVKKAAPKKKAVKV